MSVDLDLLKPEPPPKALSRRSSPSALIAGILALAAIAWGFLLLKPSIFPARHVETAHVRVESGVARASVAVEATGWVEPDPFPVLVRPLVDGTVDRVEVVEGQEVKAGVTVLARLRSSMIEGEAEKKRTRVAHKSAHLPEVKADLDEAKALLEQKLELRREVARLTGERATTAAESDVADAEMRASSARVDSEQLELDAQVKLLAGGSGSEVLRARAAALLAAARGELDAKTATRAKIRASLAAIDAQLELAKEALARPVALEAAVTRATAHYAAAEAEVLAERTELEVAEREAGWLVVTAPVDGVVLRRNAAPGAAVGPSRMGRGGEGGAADAAEGTILSLYEPNHLQARIDVPVGSVGGLGASRRVTMTAEALPGRTFHGVVTRVLSQADPLKNTLQVKVRIEDPDPLLKPEMLVRAQFLAVESASGPASASVRILVPKRAVRQGAVFVFDPTGGGRARRVPVTAGAADGDAIEVAGALGETQRVILDEVVEDERVEPMP
jgi:multidrug efflux pump subunit AcrA (membrane-fusion protein)